MAAGWIKSLPKYLSAAALLGGMSLLVPSCAENGVTIFVKGVIAVRPPECIAKASSDVVLQAQIFFDAALTGSNTVFLLVGSEMIGRGDPKTSRAEPNRVQIYQAEVELQDSAGNPLFSTSKYTVPTFGMIDPTASADATYGLVSVDLVPTSIGGLLATAGKATKFGDPGRSILISVRLFGRTLGGTEVESRPISLPAKACFGCTVLFSADAEDPAYLGTTPSPAGTNCYKAGGAGAIGLGQTCGIGQEPTDCRLCQNVVTAGIFPCQPCLVAANCKTGKCDATLQRCAL